MAAKQIGTNISWEETKTHHVLKIKKEDFTKEPFGRSKSEKTITIATTRGNQKETDADGNGIVFGINIYTYPEA